MRDCQRTEAEHDATLDLLEFIENNFGELPVRVVAGALMRTSLALAVEVFGPDLGEKAARRALENILSHQKPRKMQ